MRVYVEAHIRRQLAWLVKSLVYLSFCSTRNSPVVKFDGVWAAEKKAKVQALAATLNAASGIGRAARLSILIIPPAITTVYALATGAVNSNNNASILGLLPHLDSHQTTILLLPIGYVFGAAGVVFSFKRGRFLDLKIDGLNVYQLEDALFLLLGITKQQEFPVDITLYLAGILFCAGNTIAFSLLSGWDYVQLTFQILLGIVTLIVIFFWLRRTIR